MPKNNGHAEEHDDEEHDILHEWIGSEKVAAVFGKYFDDEKLNAVAIHLAEIVVVDFELTDDDDYELMSNIAAYGIIMCYLGFALAKLGNPVEDDR